MEPEQTVDLSVRGARKLVLTCLGLTAGQELLIFADETTLEAARLIHSTAKDFHANSTILYVSLADQVRYSKEKEIPLVTQAAMKSAKAILTCVGDAPEAMNFRAIIIRAAKDYKTKIGNCPGMSTEMLSTAVDVDYLAIEEDCHLLAVALVKGGTVEIMTQDSHGVAHTLRAALGRWERVPVTSTGIIAEGVWGNIPSGETYVAPLEGSAQGEIVINGSVPGYVFPEGQGITLIFDAGELCGMSPDTDWGARILETKLSEARSAGDPNCGRLAEIGIGVNPKVKELTGKPLLDEKKAGTAHIALGNNKDFGGTLVSSLHLDLVTRAPTITVNGTTLEEQGQLVVQQLSAQENYKTVDLPAAWIDAVEAVSKVGNKINHRNRRLLERELIDGSGRSLHVSVGDKLTAKLSAMVYDRIPNRGAVSVSSLLKQTRLPEDDLLRLLKVMQDYELVKLERKSQ